jgi:uncharacterized protein (DUF1330 family)
MAAYVVVDIEVTDPVAFEEYRKGVPATIAKYGGRYVVRGGKAETLEGGWDPKRLVILEFPSTEAVKRWYFSEEYKPLLAQRLKASKGSLVLVEGV